MDLKTNLEGENGFEIFEVPIPAQHRIMAEIDKAYLPYRSMRKHPPLAVLLEVAAKAAKNEQELAGAVTVAAVSFIITAMQFGKLAVKDVTPGRPSES